MAIGVMGCLRTLPSTFPLETPENSGNLIHANAPFEMFDDCFHARDNAYRIFGESNFQSFVNKHCSHLVITLANTLKLNSVEGGAFLRLNRFLETIDKPIVIFGLGVQAQTDDISEASLPAEAIKLMQFLSKRTPSIGVRGQMTADVLKEICGVSNTFVTGCPSLFSRPTQIEKIPRNIEQMKGLPSFNGTKLHLAEEKSLLEDAVSRDHFLVEPVNKFNHGYYVRNVNDGKAEIPYFLKRFANLNGEDRLREYFDRRYRLFRDTATWYDFNREMVSFTYGSRFHVNMASVLSGKPALWITHDARTRELTNFLKLPAISLEGALETPAEELLGKMEYNQFFENIGSAFDNFNEYLAIHALPAVDAPRI